MVYQTDNTPGFYFLNGAAWAGVGSSASTGPSSLLYASSTSAQTKALYGYSRFTFNFDNVVSRFAPAAPGWTGNNTFTVPSGMGGPYQISMGSVTTAFAGFSLCPVIYPEVQITSGSTVRYIYGVGSPASILMSGDNTDATSSISSSGGLPPLSLDRSSANVAVPLAAGDVVKSFIRANMASVSTTHTVSFSTDGSTYLNILKLH